MNAPFIPIAKRVEAFLGGYGPFDTESHTLNPVSTCNSDSNDKNDISRYGNVSAGMIEKFGVGMGVGGGGGLVNEGFVTSSQTDSIIATIFVVMAAMLFAALLGVLFYWSYNKEPALFISIISVLSFIYAAINIIYIAVKRERMEALAFKFYMGMGVMMAIINLIIAIYFGIRSRSRLNDGYGGQDRFNTGVADYQPV